MQRPGISQATLVAATRPVRGLRVFRPREAVTGSAPDAILRRWLQIPRGDEE
jgi:hypothetical protein